MVIGWRRVKWRDFWELLVRMIEEFLNFVLVIMWGWGECCFGFCDIYVYFIDVFRIYVVVWGLS